jgi:hypothetical protein
MKGDEQRGEFGTWLRRERKARFENVPAAVRSMQNEVGYGIAPSVWAELESGTRRPSEEQRQRLTRFFGSEPSKPDDDLAAAIRAQTEAMQAIAAAMTAVAEELRSDREASQGRTEWRSPSACSEKRLNNGCPCQPALGGLAARD